jgi:signal transduction histidine kinase/HD-like signal output (HDOD) protein
MPDPSLPSTTPAQQGPPGDEILSRRTELVLRELEQLPTLPSVASRLLGMGASDEVDVKEIARVIESDPALTTRLLSLCRRAAYRTRNPITTVEMAVVMLGLDAVRSLVLSVAIFDWSAKAAGRGRSTAGAEARGETRGDGRAEGRGDARGEGRPRRGRGSPGAGREARDATERPGFNRVGFWQHAIAVACCCDLIAREHPHLDFAPEEAFVAGLVHDIGKLALELVLPRAYGRVIELAEARQGNIADFERPIVGLDHAAAGACLAERWGLPELLTSAIGLHHAEPAAVAGHEHGALAMLVRLSDTVCRRLALGWSGNYADPPTGSAEEDLCHAAGLSRERVAGVIPKLYEATSARMKDLGLGDEPSQALLVDSILRANQRLGRVNQELIASNLALEAAQKRLGEARAMARLGQMTAGAAHEMNNPLAVISGRSQTLLTRLRDEQDRAAARAIVDAATRLTGLITRLNRIASPPRPVPQVVDVRKMIEQIVRTAKDRHGERVQARGEKLAVIGVKLTVADDLPAARLDPDVLTDALGEIIINALESHPRGRVEVRVDVDRHDDRLCVQVIDDGVGMSPTALSHATDPFFSEKAAGRQTGLGLALAHRLIAACDGEIDLSSRPGRGTTATVWLPQWRAGKDARLAA